MPAERVLEGRMIEELRRVQVGIPSAVDGLVQDVGELEEVCHSRSLVPLE